MNRTQTFALGLLAGTGLMYLLDPERGRRRRALIRDQMIHGAHELEDLGEAAASRSRDLRNRAQGTVAEVRARLRREEVDDPVLEQRVRAELGRLISAPGAIQVTADHGRVVLSGHVLAEEMERLISGVKQVRGVEQVIERLSTHQRSGDHPSLQGTEP